MRKVAAVFVGAWVVVVAFPYLWVLAASFKSQRDLIDPRSMIFAPTFDNWREVFAAGIGDSVVSSILVGVATVTISALVAVPGAYAISRWRAGGEVTRFGILLSEVLPPAVLVVPLFLFALNLGLRDTLAAVIASHVTFVLPVMTWFMVGFFDGVPRELEEQALVDGHGRIGAFVRVVMPQVLPGIGAAVIFGFVLSWNDLFYALILAGGNERTLPVAIASYNTFRGVELGQMAVAILVSVVPVLIASFVVQKRLVRGISRGGLKV